MRIQRISRQVIRARARAPVRTHHLVYALRAGQEERFSFFHFSLFFFLFASRAADRERRMRRPGIKLDSLPFDNDTAVQFQ